MPLPALNNFEANIHQVHQALMLFAPISSALIEKQPNWLHIATIPQRYGFVTQSFPQGGHLGLQTAGGLVVYMTPDGQLKEFLLKDHTQKSLFTGILEALAQDELAGFFDDAEGDSLPEKFFRKRYVNNPDGIPKAIEEHTHDQNLTYDKAAINDYMTALDTVYTGLARWRARLNGHLSPQVVWAEHFDLSTIWFRDPEMDEYKAHINIGFAPFTEGVFERPYLYGYAYPMQEDYDTPTVSAPLKWETEAYTGLYISYDDLVSRTATAHDIEDIAMQMFTALQSVLAE